MTSAVANPRASTAAMPLAGAGLVLVVLTAAGPLLHQRFGIYVFWSIVTVTAATAAWATVASARLETRQALMIILVIAACLRLALLFSDPILSSDMYRYIWDGRVQAAGINPYRYIPAAPELDTLRASDATIYPGINRAEYAPTIYPPAAQMLFFAITRFGETLPVMKLGLLAFEGLAIGCLIWILQLLGQPATRVAAYAWHPLPVWEIAGNGHADAAMLGLMLLGLWLYLNGKVTLAGTATTIAALIKPTALLAMPVLWRPWNWKLPALLVAITALLYLPYLGVGWKVLGFLPGYLAEEGLSAGSGFRYVGLIEHATGPIQHGGKSYIALAATLLAGLALRIGFRQDRSAAASVRALGLLIAMFLILMTPHYPWYFLAIAPFLALSRAITPWVLTVGGFILYDALANVPLPNFDLRDGMFRVAALCAFAFDYLNHLRAPLHSAIGEHRP
jgi:alpha-1,6-mannosyltransferase